LETDAVPLLYRAVSTWPPTRDEFRSDEAKGKPIRPVQRQQPVLYRGISLFDSVAELDARRERAPLPPLIVELAIPDGAPVEIHKTLGRGHWTVVGDPDLLLSYVVRLV
jgi:hypothetical protein